MYHYADIRRTSNHHKPNIKRKEENFIFGDDRNGDSRK